MKHDLRLLEEIALELRQTVIRMAFKAGGSHIGPSFSIIEILTVLYFGGILRYEAAQPKLQGRDRFILSKGHASAVLYAVLAKAGFFKEQILDTYCQANTILGGHPNMHDIPGVEASTGALGHGFPYAVGLAMAGKMDRKDYRVFAILGDGECQEGSIWEAALCAAHHKLGRFTAIVDYNKLQAMDQLDQITRMEPFAEKWESFGWDVTEVDGHDLKALLEVLGEVPNDEGPPRLIIAHTVKGKGISFMENVPLWHYRLPNEQEMKIVCKELNFTV